MGNRGRLQIVSAPSLDFRVGSKQARTMLQTELGIGGEL
jgi:hypothetical protein